MNPTVRDYKRLVPPNTRLDRAILKELQRDSRGLTKKVLSQRVFAQWATAPDWAYHTERRLMALRKGRLVSFDPKSKKWKATSKPIGNVNKNSMVYLVLRAHPQGVDHESIVGVQHMSEKDVLKSLRILEAYGLAMNTTVGRWHPMDPLEDDDKLDDAILDVLGGEDYVYVSREIHWDFYRCLNQTVSLVRRVDARLRALAKEGWVYFNRKRWVING